MWTMSEEAAISKGGLLVKNDKEEWAGNYTITHIMELENMVMKVTEKKERLMYSNLKIIEEAVTESTK